jgi:hypothetical protein
MEIWVSDFSSVKNVINQKSPLKERRHRITEMAELKPAPIGLVASGKLMLLSGLSYFIW